MTYEQAIAKIRTLVLDNSPELIPLDGCLPGAAYDKVYRLARQGVIPAIKAGGSLVTTQKIAREFYAASLVPAVKAAKPRLPKAKGKRLQEIEAAEARVLRK